MAELRNAVELVVNDNMSAGMAAAAASVERFDATVKRAVPTAEGLARRLDSLTAAEAKLEAVMSRTARQRQILDAGLKEGTITADQHARAVAGQAAAVAAAEARMVAARNAAAGAAVVNQDLARSTAASAMQMRSLAQQMPDVVQGILSGQGAFQLLVQQGGQVVQQTGSMRNALGAVVTYLGGPWMVAGVAAAAVMATMVARSADLANQQRQLDVSLRAVGMSGTTSAASLSEYVKQLERAGVARETAMATTQDLARTPGLSQQDIQRALQLAPDLAAGLGIQVPEAARRMAEALAGGLDGVDRLDAALNMLTRDQREAVRVMLNHGEVARAADLVFEAVRARIEGLNRLALGPMGEALLDLKGSWSAFMDEIARHQTVMDAVKLLNESVQGLSMIVRGDTGRRPAPPAQPGDTVSDDLASAVMRREQLLAEYTRRVQGLGDAARSMPPALLAEERRFITDMESELGRLNGEIDKLLGKRAQLMAGMAEGAPQTAAARPQAALDRNEGLGTPDAMKRQADLKWVEQNTQAWRDQQQVLAAGLPTRDAVRARLEAEAEATRRNLDPLARKLYVDRKVEEATRGASDAAIQHQAATEREAAGLLGVALAADRGRAAMIVAKAAAEAHQAAAAGAGVSEARLRDAIVNRAAAQEAEKGGERIVELREQIAATTALIAAQKQGPQAAYWAQVNDKVRLATLGLEAYRDAATDPKIKAKLDAEIARIRQLIPEVERLGAAYALVNETAADEKQIRLLEKQVELVGKSADVRERELAIFQARETLREKERDPNNPGDEERRYIDTKARLADANTALRRQEALYGEIASTAQRAFDQVGDAITQAFVQGNGAAVNFGNVARGVLSAVVQAALRLTVVNPLINGIMGGDRLPSAWSGGAAGGGAGGLGDLFGLSSLIPKDGLLSSLGLSGPTGLFSTQLISPGATQLAWAMPGDLGGITAAAGGSGGLTLGGLLGGFGLGAGAGGLLATLTGGNALGGSIGGAIGGGGAAALAAIPAIAGFLGPLAPLAPLLGGLLGGGVGGVFGPRESVRGYGFRLQSSGFGPDAAPANAMGDSLNPIDYRFYNESGREAFQAAEQLVAATNAFLFQRNLQVGGASIVGGNKNGADYSWADSGTLGEAFSKLRFSSKDDPYLTNALATRTFTDISGLQSFVEQFNSVKDVITSLTTQETPAYTKSLQDVIAKFNAAQQAANSLGVSSAGLAEAYQKAIADIEAARTETLRQSSAALSIRRLQAAGDDQAAQLAAQAENARQELSSFGKQLDSLALTAADKAARLVELEQVQAAERAKIIADFGRQAAEALRAAGGTIRQYLDALATGTAAGASPTDRLASSRTAFERDRQLAMGGDRDALGRITTQADAYLAAARDVYASGAGFQDVLAQVRGGLGNLPVVASYDQQMAESLAAIQAAFANGTAATVATIASTGNIVQIAGGVTVQPVVDALATTNAALAAANGALGSGFAALSGAVDATNRAMVAGLDVVARATVQTSATTASGLDVVARATVAGADAQARGLDVVARTDAAGTDATLRRLDDLARIGAAGADAQARGLDAVSRAVVAGNASLAAVNDNISASARMLQSGQVVANDIAAGAARMAVETGGAMNTILATSNANLVAALSAGNTIQASGASSIVTSIAAGNTLLGAANTTLSYSNSYLSYIDNTLKAQSNYILDLRAELQAIRQQLAALTQTTQQVGTAQLLSQQDGARLVADRVDALRRPLERAVAA